MFKLEAARRASGTKAKKLRREGLVPCSMNDRAADEALLFTLSDREAARLVRSKYRGGVVRIQCQEEEYPAMVSEININYTNGKAEHITLSRLYDNQEITSVARIVTKNKDKIAGIVQLIIPEIPYQALTEKMVETVEIDLGKLKAGDSVRVSDLPLAGNQDVNLLISKDKTVLHIT